MYKRQLLTGVGVLILSPDAALIRLIDMDPYGLVFWRGLTAALVIGTATLLVCGRQTLRQFRGAALGTGSLIAILLGIGNFGFVVGAERGDPAFTVVAVAASPLFAALFSWILFGERADRITLGAIALGFIGVSLGAIEVLGQEEAVLVGFLGASLVPIVLGLSFTLTRFLPKSQNVWAVYTLAGLYSLVMALVIAFYYAMRLVKHPMRVFGFMVSLAPFYLLGLEWVMILAWWQGEAVAGAESWGNLVFHGYVAHLPADVLSGVVVAFFTGPRTSR